MLSRKEQLDCSLEKNNLSIRLVRNISHRLWYLQTHECESHDHQASDQSLHHTLWWADQPPNRRKQQTMYAY